MSEFALNPAQSTICQAMASFDPERPRIYLWSGSVRSGKTWGMAFGCVLAALRRGRGGKFILAGRSIGALERNFLPAIMEHAQSLGLSFRYVRSRRTLILGDCEFHLFGGVDSRSQDAVQGLTAAGAFIDEVALLPRDFVMQCIARCSERLARIVMTCNPASPSHWVKREFFDKADDLGAVVLHSGLADNPSLGDDVISFYHQAFTGHYHRRMVMGEWVGATGLVFPRYLSSDAGITRKRNPSHVFDCGIDWGAASPTAGLVIIRDGVEWIVGDEYYWRGSDRGERTVAEHASAITGFRANWGQFDRTLIDPSAAALRAELSRQGVIALRGNNDRAAGIQALSTALALGRVKVDPKCEELVRELETLEWDERASDRGEDETVATADDHGCDALRYWCMSRLPPQISLLSQRLPVGF